MWKSVRMMWLRFFDQTEASHPIRATLRDKAVAVAGRVSVVKAGESWKGSCPVCFEAICGSNESDTRLTLALHLSLWHHDDVQSHWEIMQKKNEHLQFHLPSIVAGVGITVVSVALLAFSSKTQKAASIVNGRQPLFKSG